MRVALSIAGSDPTGGAGLQADLQVFRVFDVHGSAVPTALTVQDTAGVRQVLPVFPSVVRDQIRVLLSDFLPDAIKLGMLGSDDVLRAVDLALAGLPEDGPPIVIDPVLRSSDGKTLLEPRALPGLQQLLARAALVTPNLPEAEELVGGDVSTRDGVETAARRLVDELGAGAALVKGGHAEGPSDDCLAWRADAGTEVRWFEGKRIAGDPVHGTGCALSAAIAAGLACGHDLERAVVRGRDFVRDAIRRAEPLGQGARILRL